MSGRSNSQYVSETMRRLSFDDLEALKKEWGTNELNIIGFTDSILKLLHLNTEERINFTKGLVDVFRKITAAKKSSRVTFADCNQYLVLKNSEVEAGIYEKELPLYIREEARQYAQPPVVYGKKHAQNIRIKDSLNYRQAQSHSDRELQGFAISRNGELVFCQYNNAEELVVYDKNYRKTGELKPKSKTSNIEDTRLHVKDLEPIISFRWSEHQQAVAVLVGKSLTLWAKKENFRYGLTLDCEEEMLHVDYLEYCNLWITVRAKDGAILYWDSERTKSIQTLQHEHLVEDLAKNKRAQYVQIRFASLFCVAARNRMHFISYPKKQLTLTIQLNTPIRSISYSDRYQLLFVACFELGLHIYQLNPIHCDFTKKESRIESYNILVFVKKRPNSSTLITYDEGNHLKLWNIVDMVCYQSFKVDTSMTIHAAVCLHERLVVGVYRLGDYQFLSRAAQEKKVVEALTVFDETLYLAVNGTIRCVSLRTGKTDQILSISEEVEDLNYNETNDCLSVLSNRSVLREISVQGDELCKYAVGKDNTQVSYNRQANHYYLMGLGSRQLQVGTFSDTFVTVWSISRLRCQHVDYNYYLGLLAVIDGSVLSVMEMEASTFSLTHQLTIQSEGLLKFQFVMGTWCLLCIYRQEILVLQLGSDGCLNKKFKIPLSLEDEEINCQSCVESVDEKSRLVRHLSLYLGTSRGRLIKVSVKNCNFNLPEPKSKPSVFSREDLHRKTNVMSFDIIQFNFRHKRVDVSAFDFSYLISESLARQTKMRNIRFLQIKPETSSPQLTIICNVNMVLVYSSLCQLLGQINVGSTYPITWNVEESSEVRERQETYAKKLLSYIAREVLEEEDTARKVQPPPPPKFFAVRDQIEDRKPMPEPNRFRRRLPIDEVININNSFRRQTPDPMGISTRQKLAVSTKLKTEEFKPLMRQPASSSTSFRQRIRTQVAESSRQRPSSRLHTESFDTSVLQLSPIKKTLITTGTLDRDWMKVLKSCTAKLKRSRVKRQDIEQEVNTPRQLALPTLPSGSHWNK